MNPKGMIESFLKETKDFLIMVPDFKVNVCFEHDVFLRKKRFVNYLGKILILEFFEELILSSRNS